MICEFNEDIAKNIKKDLRTIKMRLLLEEITPKEANLMFEEQLKNYSEYTDPEDKPGSVYNSVIESAKSLGLLGGSNAVFPQDLNKISNFIKDGHKIDYKKLSDEGMETDDATLHGAEIKKRRIDAHGDFLSTAYGSATGVKGKAEKEVSVNLVNAIVVDRNPDHPGIINTNAILNNKIRAYLQELLDNVVEFLKTYYGGFTSGKDISILENAKMYEWDSNSKKLYYTRIVDNLESLVKGVLLPEDMQSSDELIRLDEATDDFSKSKLKAYNAWLFLTHFNEYLNLKYGKTIEFGSFDEFSGEDVYKIAEKGTNNTTTWRSTEEIVLEKEIPNLVQEVITTTPLYSFDSEQPITVNGAKSYLQFSDLSTIIGKIKDLVLMPSDVVFNEDTLDKLVLSDETKATIKDLTLSKVINRIRINPQKYLTAVFELLGTKLSFNYLYSKNSLIIGLFSPSEKNILYSLLKGVFSNNVADYSINALSAEDPVNNYYSWITLVCDSIFKIKFLLYYTDTSGVTRVRDMFDTKLDSIQRMTRLVIKTVNSKKLNANFDEFTKLFTTFKEAIRLNPKQFSGIIYGLKIGDKDVTITVDLHGEVSKYISSLKKDNTRSIKKYTPELGQNEWYPLLSKVIGLNIDRNFVELMGGEDATGALNALINLASRTLMLRYVSNKLLVDEHGNSLTDRRGLSTKIREILGEDTKQKLDRSLQELDLIHSSDTDTIEKIVNTLAMQLGMYSSALVKSGDGNSLSQYSLSRLLGSLTTQIDVDCTTRGAAMSESMLIKDKGLFRGVYTAKEIYDGQNAKDHTKFSTSEFAYSQLVYDFIGGLMPAVSRNSVVGNGICSFIPSVNSDKNTIGRILIDMNHEVDVTDENSNIVKKKIKDLNSLEFQEVISKELGTIYNLTYDNICSDFKRLFTEHGLQFNYDSYLEGFKNFNDYCVDNYLDPMETLKEWVYEYNEQHKESPIALIDLVHFLKGSKVTTNSNGEKLVSPSGKSLKFTTIAPNQTLLSYLYRFNSGPFSAKFDPLGLLHKSYNVDNIIDPIKGTRNRRNGFVTQELFWEAKQAEIIKSLIDSNLRLDVVDENNPQLLFMKDYVGPSWIDRNSGNVIFGKLAIFNPYSGLYDNVINLSNKEDIRKLEKYRNDLITYAQENNRPDVVKRLQSGNILADAENLTLLAKALNAKVELNPMIEKYNYADYLFTLEFMISTVGSCIAHPGKGKIDSILEEEAARYQALHKRNVSYTASMLEFLLGLLNGIPSEYNIAIIDDIHDLQSNVTGTTDDIKPFDGSTYVNPFVVYLENNSLGGAKAGITKKLFVHYYDSRTGTGGIIKTCGFGLTNDWMNLSPLLQRMMKKMSDRNWTQRNSSQLYETNILLDYLKQAINYGDIYFKKNGKYYHIAADGIVYLGNNRYTIKASECTVQKYSGKLKAELISESAPVDISNIFKETDSEGNILDTQEGYEVNSNYKLWNLFGGRFSLELQGKHLIPSENSIKNVVKAMNNIGDVINSNGTVKTQEDLYQPLKNSDIHYCPTAGAVKQGAANINGAERYHDDHGLSWMKIKTWQAGIQLDKEHHADNTELSLMTLVISACAHLGYTATDANNIYTALRTLTELGTSELLDPFKDLFKTYPEPKTEEEAVKIEEEKQKAALAFREAVVNSVVKSLAREKTDDKSLLKALASELLLKAKEGKILTFKDDIKGNLPIDNPQIYAQFLSKISVFLTNSGIKLKIPGILSVLTPSYDLFKTYGGLDYRNGEYVDLNLKWEYIENNPKDLDPEAYLNELQENAVYTYVSNEEGDTIDFRTLKIGRKYLVTRNILNKETGLYELVTKPEYIQTPLLRTELRKAILNSTNRPLNEKLVVSVLEYIKDGRNLGSYDLTFLGTLEGTESKEWYSLWDFDSTIALFELKDVLDSDYDTFVEKATALQNLATKYRYLFEAPIGGRQLDQFIVDTPILTELDVNTYAKQLEKYLRRRVRHDNAAVSRSGSKFYSDYTVYIDKKGVIPDKSTIKIDPYELILPKIKIAEFGLDTYDELNDIKSDKDFFTNKILRNFTANIDDEFAFDIELKQLNGKHIYLVNPNSLSLLKTKLIEKTPTIVNEDGKILRIDIDGNEIYLMSSTEDTILKEESSGTEIICTKNPVFYLKNMDYSTVRISDKYNEKFLKGFLTQLKQIQRAAKYNRAAKAYCDYLELEGTTGDGSINVDFLIHANLELSGPLETRHFLEGNPIIDRIRKLGAEAYNSFMKSLEIVASRTPSLSMLSFMPMRIIAFDNPNVNTAFVSTAQIWLQGSDYRTNTYCSR